MRGERKVAYLDWSGDPGRRGLAGESKRLVVAVVVAVEAGAHGLPLLFVQLREHLHLALDHEFHVTAQAFTLTAPSSAQARCRRGRRPEQIQFHYATAADRVREAFFAAAEGWPFEAGAIIAGKNALPYDLASAKGPRLLAELSGLLIARYAPARIAGSLLIVDAPRKGQPEVQLIGIVIRRTLRNLGFKQGLEVRGRPAHSEPGLQLADMLAGAVRAREAGESDYVARLGGKFRLLRP